jgi:hypothetical protein
MTSTYLRAIKHALTGNPDTPFVFVCNFEAEDRWAHGHVGLPTLTPAGISPVVRSMEELGILLAGPGDHLVLSRPPDPGFRAYLQRLGFALPTVIVPERAVGSGTTTDAVLGSPDVLRRLDELGRAGAMLAPMGTTDAEQKLADAAGLPLAVPDSATFERVNSKIYSRRTVERLGLRPVPGACCETVAEFASVLADAELPVVVKDAYGVSGKGLVVLDSPAKVARLLTMVERRARRSGDTRLSVVVESWLPKRFDLNYQVTIGQDGAVTLDFVKRAITAGGVHQGHADPAELTPAQHADIATAARTLGRHLHDDGFTGVAGIDAILGLDGTVYPVLEINARFNMSTYQGAVCERFRPPGWLALARHYPLTLTRPVSFIDVEAVLGPVLTAGPGGHAVVTCFATVNAAAGTAESSFAGRLYTMLFAPDAAAADAVDTAIRAALPTLQEHQ